MADAGRLKAVVTDLQLELPAGPRVKAPTGQAIALLHVVRPPLHFYRYLMFRVGKPWTWVYRLRMGDAELESIVHAETTVIKVVLLDGAPAGFFELDLAAKPEAELSYFGLMPHATGRGLGSWFLSEAIETAAENGIKMLRLNTNSLDHPAALPLYQRLGFVPVGRREVMIEPLSTDEMMRMLISDA